MLLLSVGIIIGAVGMKFWPVIWPWLKETVSQIKHGEG